MDESAVARSESRQLTLRALKALAGSPAIRCGPLSPLARIAAPDGPADQAGLVAALNEMDGDWVACPAALLDPGLSVALLVADREDQLLGQYAWADRHGLGAGFRICVAGAALEVHGPLLLEDLELSLLNQLALGSCAEIPPERYSLDAAQWWTLLALVDAHGTAAALRQAARASGPPPGVGLADIEASWQAGLARPNPGWAVSLAAMLAPESVPGDFPALLRAALASLEEAGLVSVLAGAPGDALGDWVLLGAGLELLCRGLSSGGVAFGLVRSERVSAEHIVATRIAGWRTPGGIVVAELSALSEDRAELLLTGPAYCAQLLGELLGTRELPEAATPPMPLAPTPAELIAHLQPATGGGAGQRFCPGCGAPVRVGARFCGLCGHGLD